MSAPRNPVRRVGAGAATRMSRTRSAQNALDVLGDLKARGVALHMIG
jgi:hypothetical protein